MTQVRYTYHWYTQPTAVLTGTQYLKMLGETSTVLGETSTAEPVDISSPGSGLIQNTLLVPLEQRLLTFTVKSFQDSIKKGNPAELALLAFHGSKAVPGMRLNLLDSQLLPALNYPTDRPVRMVVCRSLDMNHVAPQVTNQVVVLAPGMTPFNSITNDML
ncbi:MAG: hypothetical protein ACREE5_08025 [Acetobacteraceae bacterium]